MNATNAYFQMIENAMSQHTVRSYKKDVSRFVEYFNIGDDISAISQIEPAEFREFIYSANLSEASQNALIRNIGAFISWLKNDKYIDGENISTTVFGSKRYVREPKKEIIVLTDDECRAIISGAGNVQDKFMIAFMLTTGARREEVTKIKLSDIDKVAGKVSLDGKGRKQRVVGMPASILQMMEMYLAVRDSDGEYLFYSTRKTGSDGMISTISVNNRIKTAAKNAGFSEKRQEEITAHALRKTCATRLAKQFPLPVVQKILGHANIQTTMRYVGVGDASDAMVEQKLGF